MLNYVFMVIQGEAADRNYDFAAWLSSTLLGAHEVQFYAYLVSLKPVVPEASGPWGRIGLIRRRRRSVGRKLAAQNSGSSNRIARPRQNTIRATSPERSPYSPNYYPTCVKPLSKRSQEPSSVSPDIAIIR